MLQECMFPRGCRMSTGNVTHSLCRVCDAAASGHETTQRLFRLLGDLGRLHVEAETDLRAAAMVWLATDRLLESICENPLASPDALDRADDKNAAAMDTLTRLADEAVGLGVDGEVTE